MQQNLWEEVHAPARCLASFERRKLVGFVVGMGPAQCLSKLAKPKMLCRKVLARSISHLSWSRPPHLACPAMQQQTIALMYLLNAQLVKMKGKESNCCGSTIFLYIIQRSMILFLFQMTFWSAKKKNSGSKGIIHNVYLVMLHSSFWFACLFNNVFYRT